MSSGDELAGGGGREVMVFPQLEMKQQHRRQGGIATTMAAAGGYSVDVRMEKRAQKFLLFIIVFHFVCWLPLNVLK